MAGGKKYLVLKELDAQDEDDEVRVDNEQEEDLEPDVEMEENA